MLVGGVNVLNSLKCLDNVELLTGSLGRESSLCHLCPEILFGATLARKSGGKSANPGLPANDRSVQVCFVRYMGVCVRWLIAHHCLPHVHIHCF